MSEQSLYQKIEQAIKSGERPQDAELDQLTDWELHSLYNDEDLVPSEDINYKQEGWYFALLAAIGRKNSQLKKEIG